MYSLATSAFLITLLHTFISQTHTHTHTRTHDTKQYENITFFPDVCMCVRIIWWIVCITDTHYILNGQRLAASVGMCVRKYYAWVCASGHTHDITMYNVLCVLCVHSEMK